MKTGTHNTAISLFTSGGIGDLAVRAAGFDILVSNEILADRHAVFAQNFADTLAVTGDIETSLHRIETATRERLRGRPLRLFYATPPCQGMSKNGRGKLLNAVRAGAKPPMDPRNRLIIPTMDLARRLDPEVVILENVPEMADTFIVDPAGRVVNIPEYVGEQLGPRYVGRPEVVEFADYGVPQRRQRLITVYSRRPRLVSWFDQHATFIPPATHAPRGGQGRARWVTVRDAIEEFPPLDASAEASATSPLPFHRVPLLDDMKYWWVRHTPPEKGAFDNQCVACGCDENPTHGAARNALGINRASRETPLHCVRCGEMLPRPSTEADGHRVLMKGFTSAYKRMSYDKPASALTRNLSYACSDNKLHPTQHRVLSLREAFRLHTIDQFNYEWKRADGRVPSDKTIREIIGESIPPLGLLRILEHVMAVDDGRISDSVRQSTRAPSLFTPQLAGI